MQNQVGSYSIQPLISGCNYELMMTVPWCTLAGIEYQKQTNPWYLYLDGNSGNGAHIWYKSGISMFWKHLITSKESNPIFFSGRPILLHMFATCSELPSFISTMGRNRGSWTNLEFWVIWGRNLISGSLRKDYVVM